MTEDNNGTIKLGLGILIGLAVAYLFLKAVNSEVQIQVQRASLQQAGLQQAIDWSYLYPRPAPVQAPFPNPPPQYVPLQSQPFQPQEMEPVREPVSKYDNNETYDVVRDENGFVQSITIKRDAKVR